MGVIISSFNLKISPKMSNGVPECDITELYACDFVIKDFVIKKGVLFAPDPVFQSLCNLGISQYICEVETAIISIFQRRN